MAKVSDTVLRRTTRFYYKREDAVKAAKAQRGVAIQVIRGRQWLVTSGSAVIKESIKRMRESARYLGKPPPKIIADYRR